jgi:hypothetical protein
MRVTIGAATMHVTIGELAVNKEEMRLTFRKGIREHESMGVTA